MKINMAFINVKFLNSIKVYNLGFLFWFLFVKTDVNYIKIAFKPFNRLNYQKSI